MLSAEEIKYWAKREGFDLCGVVSARAYPEAEARFRAWLSEGNQARMGYLERNIEKRFDPTLLMEGCRTVVVCAVNYRNRHTFAEGNPSARIASYALNPDYHTTLKRMLGRLFERLQAEHPELTLRGRAFTDSAPLSEKSLAIEAGLGWIGRQSLLVTPQFGTTVHLGELLLSEEVEGVESTPMESRCGACRRCIEACPAGAIREDRTLDARRCIACRTIEPGAEESAEGLNGWIFGCEECQACCPHNHLKPLSQHPDFQPLIDPKAWTTEHWLTLTEEEFKKHFGTTPMTRAGLQRIQELLNK